MNYGDLMSYRLHQLLHKKEGSTPVIFKQGEHFSYAAYGVYPIFLDVETKTVRIAIDFVIVSPNVFVRASIPFLTSYPLTEVFWQ